MKPGITLFFACILALFLMLSACGSTGTIPATDSTVENQPQPEPTQETITEEPPATEQPAETPADPPVEEPATEISFTADVFPILESRCATCHGIDRIEGELVMLTYEDLMAGGEEGQVIVSGDAENSLLVELIISQKMPKRGPKLTPPQTQTIIDWVNQGALNN